MKYRVRSRVLIDITHDVEAKSLDAARASAIRQAKRIDDRARELPLHLSNAEWRSNYDGLVRELIGEAWVECIVPDRPPPGMERLVSFRLFGGEEFNSGKANILRDRIEREGFRCVDRWGTGVHLLTLHLDRPSADLTDEMKARICAPIRYDDDPAFLEIRDP